MNYFSLITIIVTFILSSCTTSNENVLQAEIHYDSPDVYSYSDLEAEQYDSCGLRFLTYFHNDTIVILTPEDQQRKIIANTNESIAYARTCAVKKVNGRNIKVRIANQTFIFPLKKDYIFIDLYYDPKYKKLKVYYSNNILLLS